MKRFLALAPAAIAVLGFVILLAPARAIDPILNPEGLPMPFTLMSVQTLPNGDTEVVYRSARFLLTLENDPALMHDPGYEGHMGTWGEIRWLSVPREYSLTVNPYAVTAPNTPVMPSWAQQLADYAAAHPEVSIVSQTQTPMQFDNGQFFAESSYTETPPPRSGCDPTSYKGYCVEYRAVISGDVSDVTFPQQVDHYLYRVVQP